MTVEPSKTEQNNANSSDNSNNIRDSKSSNEDDRILSDPGVAALLELSKEIEERQNKQMQEYQEQHSEDIAEMTKDGESVDPRELRPPGILPPQAILSTPPPPPPVLKPSEDSSSLLSPWWSEEAPLTDAASTTTPTNSTAPSSSSINEHNPKGNDSSTRNSEPLDKQKHTTTHDKENEAFSQQHLPASSQKNNDQKTNISFTIFDRALTKKDQNVFKERCILFATTTSKPPDKVQGQEDTAANNDLQDVFKRSKQCSMVCFLKFNKELKSLSTAPATSDSNVTNTITTANANADADRNTGATSPLVSFLKPFNGTFITVAKTAKRCEEHIYSENIQSKKLPDYFTIDLGEEINHSGEYVTKNVIKLFTPLQTFTQKYLDSWKDGTQQKFFARFWTTVQNGDALHLVGKSTKRMIELLKEKGNSSGSSSSSSSKGDDNKK